MHSGGAQRSRSRRCRICRSSMDFHVRSILSFRLIHRLYNKVTFWDWAIAQKEKEEKKTLSRRLCQGSGAPQVMVNRDQIFLIFFVVRLSTTERVPTTPFGLWLVSSGFCCTSSRVAGYGYIQAKGSTVRFGALNPYHYYNHTTLSSP